MPEGKDQTASNPENQNDFSSFKDNVITYPDYSIGSALITPIVMFSLSLSCSIVDLVINKINIKNEIE